MNEALGKFGSKVVRSAGQALDKFGKKFEASPYTEKLLPATTHIKLGADVPEVKSAYVAGTASIVGKVTLGVNSSVWYGATIRGDVNSIKIGENVTIGDNAVIHCSSKQSPTVIGDGTVVSAGAIVHGCTLEEGSYIGLGAQVMDGAKIGSKAMVGPGSIVTEGKTIPAGEYWQGVPAQKIRNLTEDEIAMISATAAENVTLAGLHSIEAAKTFEDLYEEEEIAMDEEALPDWYIVRPSLNRTTQEMTKMQNEVQYHDYPGRIMDHPVSARLDDFIDQTAVMKDKDGKGYVEDFNPVYQKGDDDDDEKPTEKKE